MGRFSWIIQVSPKCHHKVSFYERGRGRSEADRREGSVSTEAEVGVMQMPARNVSPPPGASGGSIALLIP